MPFVGNITVSGPAGDTPRADKAREARERRRAAKPESAAARSADEAELSAPSSVEAGEPIRSVKGNGDQEAHEDRREHAYYTLRGVQPDEATAKPKLDIAG